MTMDDGPVWFNAKRCGYGSGLPVAWQGWVITLVYMAVVFAAAALLKDRWLPLLAIVLPVTFVFMLVCARTTKGGWRWRWGDDDREV
jgi:hypothetical protein